MMHYYPHHIGDFIKETANLNDHQLATYLRMIWVYYLDEKPFDNDCESIAFAVRSDEKTVRLLLKHYFELIEDKWHQKRCDREIEHYKSNSEKGRKAAEARWNKHHQKQQTQSEGIADAMHMHTETDANAMVFNANQEPRTKNHKKLLAQPDGVLDSVWTDFVQHRKAIKAPLTDTALKGIEREAQKAGITLNNALQEICVRGWRGFKAEWVTDKQPTQGMTTAELERSLFK